MVIISEHTQLCPMWKGWQIQENLTREDLFQCYTQPMMNEVYV